MPSFLRSIIHAKYRNTSSRPQKCPGDAESNIYIILILFLTGGIRFYVCFFSGLTVFNTDTFTYLTMADDILNRTPDSYFPNGFPLIIASIKFLYGAGDISKILLILNVILSTSVVFITYLVARAISAPGLAVFSAAIVALWPNQINYTRQILSEVPAAFFLTLGIYFVVRNSNFRSGAALFLAALVRSSLLPVGPLGGVLLAARGRIAAAVVLVFGLASGGALNYGLERAGVIKPPSNFGSNLLIAIGSTSSEGTEFSVDGFSEYEKAHPLATYLTFAATNPRQFLAQRFSSLWELWGPWPARGDPRFPRSSPARFLIGLRFPLLLLSFVGFFYRRSAVEIQLVAIPIIVVTATHVLFFSTPRFTYPIEPLTVILAAIGASELWVRIRKSHLRMSTPA